MQIGNSWLTPNSLNHDPWTMYVDLLHLRILIAQYVFKLSFYETNYIVSELAIIIYNILARIVSEIIQHQ